MGKNRVLWELIKQVSNPAQQGEIKDGILTQVVSELRPTCGPEFPPGAVVVVGVGRGA